MKSEVLAFAICLHIAGKDFERLCMLFFLFMNLVHLGTIMLLVRVLQAFQCSCQTAIVLRQPS